MFPFHLASGVVVGAASVGSAGRLEWVYVCEMRARDVCMFLC